ncbi:vitellogenin [Nasonia vitripennis]|uniref:Vitellogenin n=1 Tax=Nasonia vitripennis TaxID=7425 RepID=A0A7M7G9Q4_NASVI|nr:vitellogenin [Nasonia vitripennis]
MLWSPAILLLLAGAAFASPQNGWKDGKEYTYKIRSRTLAAFNRQSKQYTGIVMEARLTVQPNGDDLLRAKISLPRYTQIHTRLENGWDSEIPQSQMNMQTFPLSGKPFEIKTKNGVVRDLIVDKDVPTWEVNVLKSIVSQLQVDTQGENAVRSKHNQFPEGNQPYALFKVMEDSVGGMCEVLYDVSALPERVIQTNPELVPIPELREDGDIISLVKTKNYSNCDQRISYHFGLNGRNKWEPSGNSKYLSRSSVSRVIVSGNLKRYTIQSSVTTNKVVLNPDQLENQHGMVASRMNLTLHEVKDIAEQVPPPSNPQSTGNLVYNYNSPTESISTRRPNKLNLQRRHDHKSGEHKHSDESSSESFESIADNNDDSYFQRKPKLTEAPQSPMLPFFIGNNGNMIHKNGKIDVVKSAKSIAQEIGNEIQRPDSMPESQTLEKVTILSRLIRTMNAEQISEVQRDLYQQRQSSNQLHQRDQAQSSRRNAWVAFRDAVAQAGTGPALVNIKQWIQNKQIQGTEAAFVVDATAKSARTPTTEYMDAFFEIVSMQETKKQRILRDSSILAFADLIRHAMVNHRSAHNRYPVHTFGRLISKDSSNLLEKYIPYMAEELKNAIDMGESQKIQVYIAAIGRTAHPRILSVFEPYLEGRKPVSPFQRLEMVLQMYKLATSHPKLARPVLYKIYSNIADHYEIRCAALFTLMKTNPPASMLQRMADFTNYDVNKHVNAAVKSIIEVLSQLQDEEFRELSNAAKAALPLLTPEKYGPQYSRVLLKTFKNSETNSEFKLVATYMGSDDSIIPKGGYLVISPVFRGMKVPMIQIGGIVNSIQDTWKFVEQKFKNFQKESQSSRKAQQQKFSPENISKLLGIHGEEPEQIEGHFFATHRNGDHYISFDNHTLEQIPEQLREMAKSMKKGVDFEETRLSGYEVILSFPMETGYPFSFTLKAPTIVSVNAQSKLMTDSELSSSELPNSATVSGKARMVYGLKVQKRLGFVIPFEHQEYIAGLDKDIQVYVPFQSEVAFDRTKNEARFTLQPHEDEKEYKILQFKSQPFTSKHDILSLQPVSIDKNTHTVHKDRASPLSFELNDQSGKQRVQFTWQNQNSYQNDDSRENKDRNAIAAATSLVSSVASLYFPISIEKAEYEKYSIKLTPSSDMNVELKASYDSLITENKDSESSESWSPNARAPHLGQSLSQGERKEKLLSEVAKNINSAKAKSVDVSVKLNAGVKASMAFTAAVGYSNVDQKSRALLFAAGKDNEGQSYHFSAGFEGKSPDTDTLDFEETLKANTRHEFDAELHYGKGSGESSNEFKDTIRIQGKAKQSEERKNQIRQSREAEECNREHDKSGNKMTQSCQMANTRASSVDSGEIIVTFESGSPLKQLSMGLVDNAESVSQDFAKVQKNREDKHDSNKIKIDFKLSPRDDKMDITLKTPEGKVEITNIDTMINNSQEKLSSQSSRNNMQTSDSNTLQISSTCDLDKTMAKTFDNHRYSLRLGKCWHVAMSSFPKNDPDRPSQQQPIPNDMHVTVLTRENENGQKELKITLGDKEIELSTSGPHEPRAKINGESIRYSKQKSHQEKQDNQIVFEIFELSDKSVKVVSDKFNVKIIYDGSRAQIQAGDRYRDSVRGLCGNNDLEPENDQQTPRGCTLQKSEEFSATYALTSEGQCEGPAVQQAEKAKSSQCTFESTRPGNVISDAEAGRTSQSGRGSDDDDSRESRRCMTHRTKVVMKNNQICFSLRPLPSCSSSCRPEETKSRAVQFHCVARSSASEKVAERVEKGANPDLTQKSVTYTESYQLPISCRA